jgi:hypothetical protein
MPWGVGLAEVLAGGLVLDEQPARPEQINEAPIAAEFLDRLLKASDRAAASRVSPRYSLLKAMARWRIWFHDSGMGAE